MSKIQLGLVAVGTLMLQLLGGWDAMLQTLVICVVLDYLTGILAAAYCKDLSSQIGYKGIIKKIGIFVVVMLACLMSQSMGNPVVRNMAISFYISNEGISILENIGKCDVDYPDFLRKLLDMLRKRGNDGDGTNKPTV